jgi:hypothetical protein
MPIEPPVRSLVSELVIAALIYAGSFGASLLVGLSISAIALGLIPGSDEGSLFLQPAIMNCAILLVNPVIFAAVAANHCRRTPSFLIPLTAVLGLRQTVLLWRRGSFSVVEAIAAVFCAAIGIALGFWVLRRRQCGFGAEAAND